MKGRKPKEQAQSDENVHLANCSDDTGKSANGKTFRKNQTRMEINREN